MSPTRWTLLAIAAVVMAGFVLLAHLVTDKAETPVLQGTEEVMVDATLLLRAQAEEALARGVDPIAVLDATWTRAFASPASTAGEAAAPAGSPERARIFHRNKDGLSLFAAWYGPDGTLLWTSYPPLRAGLGENFAARRDVARALRGEYGARSSRLDEGDSSTSVMFTSLPARRDGAIVGVIGAIKEQREVTSFAHAYGGRLLVAVGLIGGGITVFVVAVAVWLLRPMERLTDWARAVGRGERAVLPRLGLGGRAKALGVELETMREALDGRRELAAYATQVTHEMKSPLTGIAAAAELLAEPELPPHRRERLTKALTHEVARSERVLESLHRLARLEEMRGLVQRQRVDLAALVGACVARRRERARLRGVRLEWQAGVVEAVVEGEPALLEGAIDNLLENAIDFAPPETAVELRLEDGDGHWCLTVADHGPGIPDYARQRVFERFYSLRGEAQGGKGSGLGLNLVRQTAELHRGEVALDNRNGGGAVATLRLPALEK